MREIKVLVTFASGRMRNRGQDRPGDHAKGGIGGRRKRSQPRPRRRLPHRWENDLSILVNDVRLMPRLNNGPVALLRRRPAVPSGPPGSPNSVAPAARPLCTFHGRAAYKTPVALLPRAARPHRAAGNRTPVAPRRRSPFPFRASAASCKIFLESFDLRQFCAMF